MLEAEAIIGLVANAVISGTLLLPAALGEIYAERSGILNLGVEGIMLFGAFSGFAVSLATGNPYVGVVVAMLVGALIGLLHAFLSVTLKANQVISGLAITLLGLGTTAFLGRMFNLARMVPPRMGIAPVPVLSNLPVVGPILFKHNVIVYISVALTFLLWFVLNKTRVGLAIRTVGENPAMADAVGINVFRVRYACTALGGALAGLSGAYMSLYYMPRWQEGMTMGRGFVALALVIFALWDPLKALLGAYVFGFVEKATFAFQWGLGYYVHLLRATPYVFAILVLTAISSSRAIRRKVGAPASLCIPYTRE